MNPKVSMIMAVRNKEAWIADTISSILEQTMEDWELICVLDGSTDSTEKVIRHFNDPRIKIHSTYDNRGCGVALNIATHFALADILVPTSGDDLYIKTKLEVITKYFEKFPQTDIYYGAFWRGNALGVPVKVKMPEPYEKGKLLTFVNEDHVNQFIPHGFCAYGSNVGLTVPYKENRKVGIDFPFFVDCEKQGYRFGCSDDVLGIYRIFPSQVSQASREEIWAEDKKMVEEANANPRK